MPSLLSIPITIRSVGSNVVTAGVVRALERFKSGWVGGRVEAGDGSLELAILLLQLPRQRKFQSLLSGRHCPSMQVVRP